MNEDRAAHVSASRVFLAFLKLGLTSFGGPVAHLGYFRRDLVERRGWVSDSDYAEIVALSQFLPGPASSQAGFAVGLRLAGAMGGLAAFAGFTLPSAMLMLAAAWGLQFIAGDAGAAVVHGLKLVAVSIVAHAVIMMAKAHCRSAATVLLAGLALVFILMTPHPLAAPAVILAAAVSGALLPAAPGGAALAVIHGSRRRSFILLVLFGVLLAGLPVLSSASGDPLVSIADAFYRAGALVFGGGHVVLPLLQTATSETVSSEAFLAGYGVAQALPGPLFTFAGYLGALASGDGEPSLAGGLIALVFIFLPGGLLIAAALPWLSRMRTMPRASGAVRHANAAVVGVLAAAWWNPVVSSSIATAPDALIAALGVVALFVPRVPVLAVVICVAAGGAATHYWLGAV